MSNVVRTQGAIPRLLQIWTEHRISMKPHHSAAQICAVVAASGNPIGS